MSRLRTSVAFPTGNGVVDAGDGTVDVMLDRDLRDSIGGRWYWHVELEAARDRPVRVGMARPGLLGRYGPAVSAGGSAYRWLCGEPDAGEEGFVLDLPAGVPVRVCATLPYGPDDVRRFRDRTRHQLRWDVLTSSDGAGPSPCCGAARTGRDCCC